MSEHTTIVFGLGATGYSCIGHLSARDRLFTFDTRAEPPYRKAVLDRFPQVEIVAAGDWPRVLNEADRIVVSPGVPLGNRYVRAAHAHGLRILSDIELFLDAVRSAAPAAVLGVTGTNGKSTVATLLGELLRAGGFDAAAGGNLGTPALDLLAANHDAYVLELSSFQLERLTRPELAVASVLNVSADHMDRYPDIHSYAASKRRIYAGAERAVFNADDVRTAAPENIPAIALNGDRRWRLAEDAVIVAGRELPASALALKGRHNQFNILAAAAMAHLAGVDVDAHTQALTSFPGLPHRAQLVARIDGVAYVNDSKATNVGACRATLEGLGDGSDIVLIAGGDGKGAAFQDLAPAVGRHVSRLILLGRDAPLLAQALDGQTALYHATDMRDAVRQAHAAAKPGDIVLLSPACASFDMYANYEARGDDFTGAVRALPGSPGEEQAA